MRGVGLRKGQSTSGKKAAISVICSFWPNLLSEVGAHGGDTIHLGNHPPVMRLFSLGGGCAVSLGAVHHEDLGTRRRACFNEVVSKGQGK